MGTILIDELLAECLARNGSELDLTPGRLPMMRIARRLRAHGARTLGPADTQRLMEQVTPYNRVREFYERGNTAFEFSFGDASRFRVSLTRRSGSVALVMRRLDGTRSTGN